MIYEIIHRKLFVKATDFGAYDASADIGGGGEVYAGDHEMTNVTNGGTTNGSATAAHEPPPV